MNISIFGLGYVGVVSLACLARDGHSLVGVDPVKDKLDLIRRGRSPIVEEGIQELVAAVVASGRVSVTAEAAEAIRSTDISFLCVGTPANSNGDQDLTAIVRLARQIGDALKTRSPDRPKHTLVVRSTVRPGTVESVIQPLLEEHSGLKAGKDFNLCFQPEFLREGSSIADFDRPPFVVVGAQQEAGIGVLKELFSHLPCEFVHTSIRTAEMLKYACNAFHAAKVCFANEIGRLCQANTVDPHAVMRLLCLDRQLNISPAYLQPGFAFGGSCLPKDLQALLYMAKTSDVEVPMLAGVLPSNRIHVERAIDMVLERGRCPVGLIGLSFKSGTDDLRNSPMVAMAEHFIGKGMDLCIYDPEVQLSRLVGANRRFIEESIPHIASLMSNDLGALVRRSEVLVVGLKAPQIVTALEENTRDDQLLLDLARLPDSARKRVEYRGVCW